jgi:hypothetical protein
VTCGAAECQRRRHAKKCKRWHADNRDVTASHYEDVVKPYRKKHPDYQRRWRLVVALCEIREEMVSGVEAVGARMRKLLARGRAVVSTATCEPAQPAGRTGEALTAALDAGASIVGVLEELSKVIEQLGVLGG